MKALLVGLRRCEYESSLALGMLKAAADAKPSLRGRWDVSLRTFTVSERPAAELAASRPDLVGLSVYLWNLSECAALAAELKRLSPGTRVVVGGAEPTSRPEQVLRLLPDADWAAFGEGEETFAELLEVLAQGGSPTGLAGLAWREGEEVRLGAARAPADLDALPSPWQTGLLPHSEYPALCFEASRGCPFDCKYCDWQNKSRVRRCSEARAVADMAALLARRPDARVFVCDSDLFLEPRRGARLARAWRETAGERPCAFEVHTYLPRLDDEALRALDSPRFTVCVGIQTANPEALSRVSRFFDAEATRERAAAFRRLAPRARLNLQLIYGLPGDDPAGFRASLDYALGLEPDSVMLFPALALPGSELGRDPAAFGLRRQEEPPYRVLETDSFSAADLAAADLLAFHLFTLQRHPAAARVLRRVGRVLGYARAFESFAAASAGTEFDLRPAYERARRGLLGFVTHAEEPWAGLPRRRREAGVLSLLARWAKAALEEAGKSAQWPALAQELAAERRAALWRELAGGAAVHRLLEAAAGAPTRGGLWVGAEENAEAERPLWPEAERAHWLRPGPRPAEPCRAGRHFLDAPEGLDRRSPVALSQLLSLMDGEAGDRLLSRLREASPRGAALAVVDSLAPDELRGRLERAGWRLRRAPAPLGGGEFTLLAAEPA